MKSAVLFDLGGTLVHYYGRSDIPQVLREVVASARDYLDQWGLLGVSEEETWERAAEVGHEAGDHRVRPLGQRLMYVFGLEEEGHSDAFLDGMYRCFLEPVFRRARRYDDALPVLERLRADGYKIGIVSNTAWGSPGHLWREELVRHGLGGLVDVAVFCTDVGWRKPAPQIFAHALERLGVGPQECVFIGDDPRWDLQGPRAVGIEAVLLDRGGTMEDVAGDRVRDLYEFYEVLQASSLPLSLEGRGLG